MSASKITIKSDALKVAKRLAQKDNKMTTDKTAIDALQIKTMFDNILTIDSHFGSAGYSGDNVTLKISDLAKFIRFYQPTAPQPSGDAVKQDDALQALDRLNYAAYGITIGDADEIDADTNTIRAALTQPKADVEGLKDYVMNFATSQPKDTDVSILMRLIDHLAAQGYIGGDWQPIDEFSKTVKTGLWLEFPDSHIEWGKWDYSPNAEITAFGTYPTDEFGNRMVGVFLPFKTQPIKYCIERRKSPQSAPKKEG